MNYSTRPLDSYFLASLDTLSKITPYHELVSYKSWLWEKIADFKTLLASTSISIQIQWLAP